MGLLGATSGAVTGVGVMMWSNALRRMPLMTSPWEHAIGAVIGGSLGYSIAAWEAREEAVVAQARAAVRVKNEAGIQAQIAYQQQKQQ